MALNSPSVGQTALPWSTEQLTRLKELGATPPVLDEFFSNPGERNRAFQALEKKLSGQARAALENALATDPRPPVLKLAEQLGVILRGAGFAQVETPIIMARQRLVKMGLEDDPLLADQVFWLDHKKCLRPMLAPHLYELMLDLSKIRPKPFGLFEIGPCFRKESQGARHANEFTMLNLVEVGTPLEERGRRLADLIALIMDGLDIKGWRTETTDSTVYGETVDVVNADGLELASTSMGPHPLDVAWGFSGTWVGLGFGLERLAMTLSKADQLSRVGRNLSYLYRQPLKL